MRYKIYDKLQDRFVDPVEKDDHIATYYLADQNGDVVVLIGDLNKCSVLQVTTWQCEYDSRFIVISEENINKFGVEYGAPVCKFDIKEFIENFPSKETQEEILNGLQNIINKQSGREP